MQFLFEDRARKVMNVCRLAGLFRDSSSLCLGKWPFFSLPQWPFQSLGENITVISLVFQPGYTGICMLTHTHTQTFWQEGQENREEGGVFTMVCHSKIHTSRQFLSTVTSIKHFPLLAEDEYRPWLGRPNRSSFLAFGCQKIIIIHVSFTWHWSRYKLPHANYGKMRCSSFPYASLLRFPPSCPCQWLRHKSVLILTTV